MRLRARVQWWRAMALLGACLGSATPAQAAEISGPSVLVLLPGQAGQPAASAIATGLRLAIVNDPSLRVTIDTEHLDVANPAAVRDRPRRLLEHYRSKYGNQHFDLVVAAGYEPARFAVREHARLWPRTPVIVCAVDERSTRWIPPAAGVTYLTTHYDAAGTLSAALALLPDTRHVALVGGAGSGEDELHDLVRKAVRDHGGRLDLIDLTRLSTWAMLARLPSLPPDTVVFISSFLVDGSGRPVYGLDFSRPIAEGHPTFTFFGSALGRGIVGGVLTDFEALGFEAGTLTLKSLRGKPLPASPVKGAVTGVSRFDGRQLVRWGLDAGRLPADAEVLYRQETLWQQYRWHIVLTLAVIAGQAVLIVSLLVQRRRRHETQARLARSLRMEALTGEIATDCATVPLDAIDERICHCLRRLATFLGVDRAALWQPSSAPAVITVTHSWRREGVAPHPAAVNLESFPYFQRCLEQRPGGLICDRLQDLPAEAGAERAAFAAEGVRSVAAIPLHAGDRWLGVLALVNRSAEYAWSDDLVGQLRAIAEHFAHGLARAQSAAALASSAALTSAIVGALPGETAIIDADGTILQTNEAWAASVSDAGMQKGREVGGNYLEACRNAIDMPPDIARKVYASIQSVLAGKQDEFALEYPSSRQNEDRWLEVRVRRLHRLGGGAAVMHLDVTARRQAEAAAQRHVGQLAHLDRVAGMGQLASSIAHELNQPLTAILTNAQAATRILANDGPLDVEELRACLADIVSDDQRAAEVIRHMRRLLKKTDFASLPLHLNDLVVNTISLVANDALLHAVNLQFLPAPALPVTYGDLVQIQQVILNLLTNAIAAASDASTRKVTVWTAVVTAPFIELGVHDSGKGIDEAALEHLFEPFFTTKSDGLGMGLAISRTIVEAHGGRIVAENDPAGGATFRVHLRTDRSESG